MKFDDDTTKLSLNDLISLKGKSALITGASSGIGRAMAYRFAESGSSLILVDIDLPNLETLKRDLSSYKVDTTILGVDLSKKKEVDTLWKSIENEEPDILVNNAGIYPFVKFEDIDENYLERIMSINLKSVFWMCQKMIVTRRGKGGVIVNVSSVEAILPFKDGLTHYGPSKAGVIALSRSLAKEYGREGFRVNVLIPGGINTEGTRKAAMGVLKLQLGLVKDGIEFMSRLPLKRFGYPDEVARVAVFLASDLASYVTGSLIPVDGGFLSA